MKSKIFLLQGTFTIFALVPQAGKEHSSRVLLTIVLLQSTRIDTVTHPLWPFRILHLIDVDHKVSVFLLAHTFQVVVYLLLGNNEGAGVLRAFHILEFKSFYLMLQKANVKSASHV